jgi:HSP20 family protein
MGESKAVVAEGSDIAAVDKRQVDTRVHQELRSGNWFVPATDIYEAEDRFVLVMDMSGVCYDCVHVNIVEDELVVTGHVTHGEDQDDYVLYREYDVGHYHRHFGLLDSIDRESIHAVMSNGVLTITMSKVKEVVPRRIPIRGGE